MSERAAHRVVIVGGGFGGLNAALALRKAPVQVTMIDKRNYHLFQPLLYQVATGGLSPANISAPLRAVLRKQKNCTTLMGEVTAFDMTAQEVVLSDGGRVGFDSLILACGATNNYFNHPEWEAVAPGLKSIEEATDIRSRILTAFELAERESDPIVRQKLLTFVVVGGGPTGVELCGAICELAHSTMKNDFRNIDPRATRILLIDSGERVLSSFPEKLSLAAMKSLAKMGVEVISNTRVVQIHDEYVVISRNKGPEEIVPAEVSIWAAGVKASPLGKMVADLTGCTTDRGGRVQVEPDMSLRGHPNLFVIGDMMTMPWKDGLALPGVSPVAMQQGAFVARLIDRRLAGLAHPGSFRYWDKGSMATIGRASAIVDAGFLRFSGFFAWLAWLFVHIAFLIQFENRLLVMSQWFWNYITRNRYARLITGNNRDI